MRKLLALLILLTIGCGIGAGVTIKNLAPAYATVAMVDRGY